MANDYEDHGEAATRRYWDGVEDGKREASKEQTNEHMELLKRQVVALERIANYLQTLGPPPNAIYY